MGDLSELDAIKERAKKQFRKSFHEAKNKYNNDKNGLELAMDNLNSQYNEMVEILDSKYKESGKLNIKNESQKRQQLNRQTNDEKNDRSFSGTSQLGKKPSSNNNEKITKKLRSQVRNNSQQNRKHNDYNYYLNMLQLNKTIPNQIIEDLKDTAKIYYTRKCMEYKQIIFDKKKLKSTLDYLLEEFNRKNHYFQGISSRYMRDVQKIKREIINSTEQNEFLELLVQKYCEELQNAKILAENPLRNTVQNSSSRILARHCVNNNKTVKNDGDNNEQKLEEPSMQKVPNNKLSVGNLPPPPKKQKVMTNNDGNNAKPKVVENASKISTNKLTSSKLSSIIARLRLRAREEFKTKMNVARDSTRKESDFANCMKFLREEYYNAIDRINKIPTMNKEYGIKYVQSLQEAQSALKVKDPELEDLLQYLKRENSMA